MIVSHPTSRIELTCQWRPRLNPGSCRVLVLDAVLNAAYIFWNYGGMVNLVTIIPPSISIRLEMVEWLTVRPFISRSHTAAVR